MCTKYNQIHNIVLMFGGGVTNNPSDPELNPNQDNVCATSILLGRTGIHNSLFGSPIKLHVVFLLPANF